MRQLAYALAFMAAIAAFAPQPARAGNDAAGVFLGIGLGMLALYALQQEAERQQYYGRYQVYPPPPRRYRQDRWTYYDQRRRAPRYCNYQACAYSYRSFDPRDCTYQMWNGRRHYCTK